MNFDLRNVSVKNIKKQKRLVFRLKVLFLNDLKASVQEQNSDQKKKTLLLNFLFFEGTPRPQINKCYY